ncbi:uncharacterized protein LOC128208489 [Mya arenaria]|uniref:uncharacterized protein LOC128208489 n=1 Tax=Mya arenaria TaxID=6604 RepID=UPI0022E6EEBC|nr:uncharacterized protein LOC128208489 [Mya arenaria]
MSLNPDLGHLYHDNNISSVFTKLDVQEKLRTREINARESKYLEKYSKVIDRASKVCQRRTEKEKREIETQLRDIRWRTPRLTTALRQESERERVKKHAHSSIPEVNASHEKRLVLVSSWSVYSSSRVKKFSALESNRSSEVRQSSRLGSSVSGRTANFTKQTKNVTRALHRLYNRSFERRSQQQNMTVLDILGRESREELEKALFALRGTPAGDLIEDILCNKELVSKQEFKTQPSESVKQETNGTMYVAGISDGSNSDSAYGSGHLPKIHSASEPDITLDFLKTMPVKGVGTLRPNLGSSDIRNWLDKSGNLVTSVFEQEDAHQLSSVLGNASDTQPVAANTKWTEIFKTPELWRQRGGKVTPASATRQPRTVNLVTLTGKRRQTMLRR